MRDHIKRTKKKVFNPARHRWINRWDYVVGAAVMFTAVVSPVEFSMRKTIEFSLIYSIGLVINGIFCIDLFVNFNRGFNEPRSKGARFVSNRKRIAIRYLKGWFLIDLFSAIPFDLPFALGLPEEEWKQSVRLAGLLKLARTLHLGSAVKTLMNALSQKLNLTHASARRRPLIGFLLLWQWLGEGD